MKNHRAFAVALAGAALLAGSTAALAQKTEANKQSASSSFSKPVASSETPGTSGVSALVKPDAPNTGKKPAASTGKKGDEGTSSGKAASSRPSTKLTTPRITSISPVPATSPVLKSLEPGKPATKAGDTSAKSNNAKSVEGRLPTTVSPRSSTADTRLGAIRPTLKAPSIGAPKVGAISTPTINSRPGGLSNADQLRKRLDGMKAIEELGRAGMAPDLSNVGGISDPVTGESIDIHRGSALSGLGNGTLSGTLGNRNSIFNEVAGGGTGPAAGGAPGGDDARSAARAGKGRAASDDTDSDGDVVTDETPVTEGGMTYGEATTGDVNVTDNKDGTTVTILVSADRTEVYVKRTYPDGQGETIHRYRKGEKVRSACFTSTGRPCSEAGGGRPAPDDAGSSGGAMTAEQRKKAEQDLRNLVDPSVNPGSDGDGGTIAARGAGSGEALTDTDLAGQPVDDETGGGRGAPPPVGSITTDIGLAGQPVGDDTSFGTLNPGPGGSLGVAGGGFGSALVRGAAGTHVPTSVSDRVADDIGARVNPEN